MTPLESAWQAALAAEHQAVFGYSLLGVQLSGTQQQLAIACSDSHETLRDSVTSALLAAGLTPVATQADYPTLYPVPDAGAARALAVRLEADCAQAWRYLYLEAASSAGTQAHALRALAQQALTASAVRAVQWRVLVNPDRPTVPFPGT